MGCSCPVLRDPTSYKRKQSSALERTELYVPRSAGETYSGGTGSIQFFSVLPVSTAGSGTVELLGFHFTEWLTLNAKNCPGDFSPEVLMDCFSTHAHLTFCSQQSTVEGNVP